MNAVKELLEAIQNEGSFENSEVEKAFINALELVEKDLTYVQYEPSSDVEAAIVNMNKEIAKANAEIEVDEDDDDEEEEDIELELDDDEDDEEELLELEPEEQEDDTTNDNESTTPTSST